MEFSDDGDYTELLQSLQSVVMDLNDMENMIDNFEEDTAETFFTKVNEYIRNLKEVKRLGPTCKLQVPREALERLDHDSEQNPEIFAQEILARCRDEFGQLNARVQGITTIKNMVAEGWRNREQANSAGGGIGVPVGAAAQGRHGKASSAASEVARKGAPKSPAGSRSGIAVQSGMTRKR